MRRTALSLLVILASPGIGFGQLIVATSDGEGYWMRMRAAEGTQMDLGRAQVSSIVLGRNPWKFSELTRGVAKPLWLPLPTAKRSLEFNSSGDGWIPLSSFPRGLLGAQGVRFTIEGSRFVRLERLITPATLPIPPRIAPGQSYLLLPSVASTVFTPNDEVVAVGKRAFRKLTLKAQLREGNGWSAYLEGAGPVRLIINPKEAEVLLPLCRDPQTRRYVGREFWAYPNSIEALSGSGKLRGTALLDRHRVRVLSVERLWRNSDIVLSGPLWAPGDEIGRAGIWNALHGVFAVVEPVGEEPVRISLPRPLNSGVPVSVTETFEFVRKPSGRRYFLFAADLWDLDRKLSASPPERSLKGASSEIRRAVSMANPVAGMTPAQVGWAIGWPNDPMPREILERFRDGVWEYPAPFGWNQAVFQNGRLVSYGPGLR